MNHKIHICLIFLIALVLSSCEKYLDKKPSNGIIVPSSLQDLQALLDDGLNMNQRITPSFGEASADNHFVLEADFPQLSSWEQNVYKWIADDNYKFQNDWSAAYTPVFNASYCLKMIEEIPKISENEALWYNVKGSALFFRSYFFLQLVWTYSKAYDAATASTDLGIPIRIDPDFNIISKRASVKETYERIINDTKEALDYLPENPVHKYRPSRPAAYGLLARTYLSMRNYDSALKYSDLYLQIKNSLIDFNGSSDLNGTNATYSVKRFNRETIFYSEMNLFLSSVNSYAKIDTLLYASYEANDLRKVRYFKSVGDYFVFRASYAAGFTHFTGIATDEMFLTRAESYARTGNITSALDDLNILLAKRYDLTFVPVTAIDQNDAVSKILNERRKELLMRGLRFVDIKRLNKEGHAISLQRHVNGQTYTLVPNDKKYALPIPREIIVQSGIQQN